MDRRKIKIAVVEDNGMARIMLRNHLSEMGFSSVSCYSQGKELKRDLKANYFDLILMDFHLGDNKNGVEVIQEISREGMLPCSTALIFITSDRLPLIIGQIVDIHPDDLVIKPYTIRILEKVIINNLVIRAHCLPIYAAMENRNWQLALEQLDDLVARQDLPKSRTALLKLRARLLIKLQHYDQATHLYEQVLSSSANVIWAKWGVIHTLFLAGKIEISEDLLKDMLGAHLTNDKACEWLARICVDRKEFEEAEEYIDLIKESSLSMAAAKLKAYVYQQQDKMDQAIDMLERKRLNNQHVREKYAELSLELARCYLAVAEANNPNERAKPLQVARFLIGTAGRSYLEENLVLKRNYINILAAVLEDDLDRAASLLEEIDDQDLSLADIPTMTDAVKAYMDVGDEKRAAQILFDCEKRMQDMEDMTEKTISTMSVAKREEQLGERRPRALKFNKQGLQLHNQQQFDESVDYFYQAYILFPRESAFGLNLLQGLVESKKAEFKDANTIQLFNQLSKRDLNDSNRKRLDDIGRRIAANKDEFIVADSQHQQIWKDIRTR